MKEIGLLDYLKNDMIDHEQKESYPACFFFFGGGGGVSRRAFV